MEARKLQRLGASSLVVTLPREWVKRFDLKPGDQVYIVDEGDSLRVYPADKRRALHDVFQAEKLGAPRLIARSVSCLYIMGYNDVEMRLDGLGVVGIGEVKAAANNLLGLEVEEEEPGRIRLKYMVDPSKVDVKTTIRSMGINVGHIAKLNRRILEGLPRPEAEKTMKALRAGLLRDQHSAMRYLISGTGRPRGERVNYSLLMGTGLLGLAGDLLLQTAARLLEARDTLAQDEKGRLAEALAIIEDLVPQISSTLTNPSAKRAASLADRASKAAEQLEHLLRKSENPALAAILATTHNTLRVLLIVANIAFCSALADQKYWQTQP